MSLDSEDAGNAVFLGNRRIDMSGRKYKLRKTDGQISEVFNSNLIKVFIGSRSLVNTVLSSGYKVFGAFFIHGRVIIQVSQNTAKHRLKSLQIEYYGGHKLSKMSIRNL